MIKTKSMKGKQFVFTNETPSVIENLTPGDYLRIIKFVSLNELNFVMSPSLGFRVTYGTNILDIRVFVSLLSANQRKPTVVETELKYVLEKTGPLKIEIVNQEPERLFHIAMLYNIDHILKWSKV